MSRVNAVRIHRNGGPEELRHEEIEIGDPGPGEARVRHTAIGLNFTDIHHRTGRYPLPQFPHVIGMEAAGVVEAVGAGVSEVRSGDRVAYASDRPRAQPRSSSCGPRPLSDSSRDPSRTHSRDGVSRRMTIRERPNLEF